MSMYRLEYDRLLNSIAYKAGVTTSEFDAYLNKMLLSVEANRRIQAHYESFTLEEKQFINDVHRFPSNENLKESRVPVLLPESKETLSSEIKPGLPVEASPKDSKPTSKKPRSRRVHGRMLESDLKIISALSNHHGFEKGNHTNKDSCTVTDPIKCNKLAKTIRLATSTLSRFFKKEFKGYKNYILSCTSGGISSSLALLNDHVSPHILLGDKADKIGGRIASDEGL